MKIHALTTGAVRVKHSFLFPRRGARRQLDLFLPGAWSDPLPIHCWAIEHDGVLRLVDTGETAAARNVPFARMEVTRDQELPGRHGRGGPGARRRLGGRAHPRPRRSHRRPGPRARAGPDQRGGAALRRLSNGAGDASRPAPATPPGIRPSSLSRSMAARFGAFPRSRALSDDGRIVAVDTPGHTPGHVSVICVDDSGRHVMLAGDATDSLEQLRARRAGRDWTGPEGARRDAGHDPGSLRAAPDDLPAVARPRVSDPARRRSHVPWVSHRGFSDVRQSEHPYGA